jgi:hypothetical protein
MEGCQVLGSVKDIFFKNDQRYFDDAFSGYQPVFFGLHF